MPKKWQIEIVPIRLGLSKLKKQKLASFLTVLISVLYPLTLILFLTLFRKCQNSDTIEMFQSVSKKISGDGGTVSLL